jgi:hypothetical protein
VRRLVKNLIYERGGLNQAMATLEDASIIKRIVQHFWSEDPKHTPNQAPGQLTKWPEGLHDYSQTGGQVFYFLFR